MELYIIRHGQTFWNAEGRLQGQSDIELNENGKAAALSLGESLKDTHFDCIYSSPLKRAYETACLIRGNRDIPIVKDDRLAELSFGTEEGTDFKKWISGESPYHNFFEAPEKYIPPKDGESLQALCVRTKEFVKEIIEPQFPQTERVMIVAHGALNKGVMSYLEGNDIAHFWGNGLQKNCDADIFSYDGGSWSRRTH